MIPAQLSIAYCVVVRRRKQTQSHTCCMHCCGRVVIDNGGVLVLGALSLSRHDSKERDLTIVSHTISIGVVGLGGAGGRLRARGE